MTVSSLPESSTTVVLQRSHPALRHVSVEDTGETLVIKGAVSSYYLKQLAQETVKAVQGARQVVNEVHVVSR
jgi:osmotically-inducible protein OsmY